MPPFKTAEPSSGLTTNKQFAYEVRFQFQPFYDPYICDFIKSLNRDGVDGLRKWTLQSGKEMSVQTLPDDATFGNADQYNPNFPAVADPLPVETVTFKRTDPYSLYHWELFFHLPLTIAQRYFQDQKFDQCLHWLESVFDPTDGSPEAAPARYWKVRPFREAAQRPIQDELAELFANKGMLGSEVNAWRNDAFDPHRLAHSRKWAYPKAVVMKYLDALMARGDQLYQQYTVETINQAMLYYVLASEILGDAPPRVAARAKPTPTTYENLASQAPGAFADPEVACENLIFGVEPEADGQNVGPTVRMLYFCIPQNEKLLRYWNDVASRLENIRQCRNIEGELQPIPLFGPPIDPDLLVRAAAAGIDLGTVLADLNAPPSPYRFQTLLQRAIEFCSDLRSLGASLLSVLEKRDGEAIALLRAGQEMDFLGLVTAVKEKQVREAEEALAALNDSRRVIKARLDYYTNIPFLNAFEARHLDALSESVAYQTGQAEAEALAAILHLVPEAKIGFDAGTSYGGENVAGALQAFGGSLAVMAGMASGWGALAAAMGSFQRRQDEWTLQKTIAAGELAQIDHQILGANIRLEIARQELSNHQRQVDHAVAVNDFMQSKATNQELFDWMVAQTSAVYFQAYQLAYNMAKRAERAFQLELASWTSSFIQFGYWDSLKKGLLAGDRLQFDLRRLEAAYLDQNKREYEITKHFSLATSAPIALLALRQTGQCFVEIPEAAYDADYPGLFMRRIRTLAITVPGVIGPYTSVNCTVTMVSNRVRVDPIAGGVYPEGAGDKRFRDSLVSTQSIVTSTAANDTGVLFQDERTRPFEFAGAICQLRLEMPRETNRFDLGSISDVVITIQYTARNGGDALKIDAMKAVLNAQPPATSAKPITLAPGIRLLSATREFSNEWYRFGIQKDKPQKLVLDLSEGRFPYHLDGVAVMIDSVRVVLQLKRGTNYDLSSPLRASLLPPGAPNGPEQDFKPSADGTPDLIEATFSGGMPDKGWTLWFTTIPPALGVDRGTDLVDPSVLQDCFLLCAFSVK